MKRRLLIVLLVVQAVLPTRSHGAQSPGSAEKGEVLFRGLGCLACHKVKGEGANLGPDLNGVYGKIEELTTGEKIIVTDDYIIESIVNPIAKAVKGFPRG